MYNRQTLKSLSQTQLETWVMQARRHTQEGKLPKYIPLLAQANPNWLAVQIQTVTEQSYNAGDTHCTFPLMSVVKPFILLFLLQQLGAKVVFSHVGMKPSDLPFNSLTQLIADEGFPRNTMINSGAIALCSILPGINAFSRCENLRLWLNQTAGCQLTLDNQMLDSVRSLPNDRNLAITRLLTKAGNIHSPETTLDAYNHVCCLAGTVADLARIGMLLVQAHDAIAPQNRRIVNATMMTCGLYQASARFASEVGLPTKSGVSGAILSIVPTQGAIACYSPGLDETGNSKAGIFLIQQLAQNLNLSIFG
ncbi:L-glutaminase [Chroococcidiopsis thermalis PCC 7203]|uniref:Glutaminase n=1 Tax=Chroococcidiopsis thermalis (strain PCC 7203) TaxID=251229 RepID=K9TYK5_CHRTP|nr:L-glutaminase [Chroococcidiopsis thermalis PCC 7203]